MRAAIVFLLLAKAALAQPAGKPSAKAVAAPVIGCPSLANYRLLRRQAPDEAAAAARLADPKADHLGCAAFPRDRVAALADHVALGGQAYDCLSLQGTAICHWTEGGTATPVAPTQPPQPRTTSPDKGRR